MNTPRFHHTLAWMWLYAAANGVDELPWGTGERGGYLYLPLIAFALVCFLRARVREQALTRETVPA